MYWNYLKIAVRNLKKYKLYAAINILGLALGMTIYLFGAILIDYEKNHDTFYANSERIYTIGAYAAPELDVGIDQMNSTFPSVGPLIASDMSDVEAVARTMGYEYLVSVGAEGFYETAWFADTDFLRIFDFAYIHGDATALDDPDGLMLTESMAIKYFGTSDAVGEVVTFDNSFDFRVNAVIEDIPRNSHFNSLPVLEKQTGIFAPMTALVPATRFSDGRRVGQLVARQHDIRNAARTSQW